jgi:alpha-beta hydrolase superfamily lysophospholipase
VQLLVSDALANEDSTEESKHNVKRHRSRILLCLIMSMCGCVPDRAFRSTVGVCPTPGCQTGSIEVHPVNTEPPTEYLLGVVEFDDQGAKYVPTQMDALFSRLQTESAAQDLCLVVFVHGWENNAAYDNGNVQEFRTLLETLARTESQHPPGAWGKPRKVVGIYAGWRGQTLDAGDLSDITFWDRKDAAQRVALGSIRELLGRARGLHDTIDRTTWSGKLLPADAEPPPGEKLRSTRLLTIGHSFGGLIVYTALAQYFTDRAAASATAVALGATDEKDKMIAPYGDLVVIINPAVEAISWEPVRQLVQGRKAQDYARDQKPVFVEVTSTADDATGIAFPLGRTLNTATESFVSSEERREANLSFGHYPPFWTHDLTAADGAVTKQAAASSVTALTQARPTEASAATHAVVLAECKAHAAFEAKWRRDGYLQPGWTRRYTDGAVLTQRADSGFDPNDPFWIIRTDKSMIAGHSDIEEPVFVDFVRQLYDELLLDGSNC